MAEAPFLILTLRRTGGTATTGIVGRISRYRTIQHEPFNIDRLFGHIHAAFATHGDTTALFQSMERALERKSNIKHCIELVPYALTAELINVCSSLGYKFILLTREDEVKRQSSLALALSTSDWGPKGRRDIYTEIVSGRRTAHAIDLAAMEERVVRDNDALIFTIKFFKDRNIPYLSITFEDIFASGTAPAAGLHRLCLYLNIDISGEDPRLVSSFPMDAIGSQDISAFVDNYSEWMERVRKLVEHLNASSDDRVRVTNDESA
jgi:hypothetical protein